MSPFFQFYILPILAWLFICLVGITSRTKIINKEVLSNLRKKGKGIIFAFWHGRQFPLVYSQRSKGICIMTSYSRDGELQTRIFSKFGYYVIRGSATRGGAKALIKMIREVELDRDIAIPVDGPRGPVYKSKPGAIYIAQRTGRPIVPIGTAAKRKIIFSKAWDKYLVALPLNKCVIVCGQPMYFDKKTDIQAALHKLDQAINYVTEKAQELV